MRKDDIAANQPVLSKSICADITVVSAHWVWREARCCSASISISAVVVSASVMTAICSTGRSALGLPLVLCPTPDGLGLGVGLRLLFSKPSPSTTGGSHPHGEALAGKLDDNALCGKWLLKLETPIPHTCSFWTGILKLDLSAIQPVLNWSIRAVITVVSAHWV